jgi:CRP/FNR family transcriptional regulator/CRP/FNR family cyclic AMP-dependent transcriptional regulator
MVDVTPLREIPLFSSLSDDELRAIARKARRVRFAKGQVMFQEGDDGSHMLAVLLGRVKVSLAVASHQEIVLNIVEPPDTLGELSVIDGRGRSASATALEETECLSLTRAHVLEVVRNHAHVAELLLQEVTRRLRDSTDQNRTLSMLNVPDRVVRSLLKLSKVQGTTKKEWIVVTFTPSEGANGAHARPTASSAGRGSRPTHQLLAEMSGCSREAVSRALRTLRQTEEVRVRDDAIEVRVEAARRYWSTTDVW